MSAADRTRAQRREGGCLCGAVRFSARLPKPEIQACHCVQCQRWTGGGPLMVVKVEDLEMIGEDGLSAFRASEWGERLFCRTCGATITWRMAGAPTGEVAVGLLDDQSGLSVAREIFVDHRPGWLPVWEGATQSDEAEEMARLDAYLKDKAT